MTPAALLAAFRLQVADVETPYLWSDVEVYQYMDEAQNMFCRLGEGITDSQSTEAAQLVLTASEPWVDLHPSVLAVRGARDSVTGTTLSILSYEDVAGGQGTTQDWPVTLSDFDREATPLALISGMSSTELRCVPTPDAAATLYLVVERLPLLAPDTVVSSAVHGFEIAAKHHYSLLPYMKHLAYGKHDADTFDKERSESFLEQFTGLCALVKAELARRRHKPRLIRYGGL